MTDVNKCEHGEVHSECQKCLGRLYRDMGFAMSRVMHDEPEPGKYNFIYIYEDGAIDIVQSKSPNLEGVKWLHAHTVIKVIPNRPENNDTPSIEIVKQKKFRQIKNEK